MKIIINGAGGRMGREVARLIEAPDECVAKIDKYNTDPDMLKSLFEYEGEADVIIDFSYPVATPEILKYAENRGIPLVIATTGHTDAVKEMISEASKHIPIFFSANMSLGVALLVNLAKQAAKAFPDADIEIVETHHNRKIDAPSGTAFMIADAIKEVRGKCKYIFGRRGRAPRIKGDIGIHAVRGGNIVGTHEVMLITDTQTITLKHEAHDRALFAEGAISAARFVSSSEAGLYDMYDMIEKL